MDNKGTRKKDLIPLWLLQYGGEKKVSGITRLQKLVFLAQHGGLKEDPIPDHELSESFNYKAFDYGPFSKELYDRLDALAKKGYVDRDKIETPSGNERYDYKLSPEGVDYLDSILDDLPDNDKKIIKGVKILYNETPLFELIDKVYTDFPEYAKDSKLQ